MGYALMAQWSAELGTREGSRPGRAGSTECAGPIAEPRVVPTFRAGAASVAPQHGPAANEAREEHE